MTIRILLVDSCTILRQGLRLILEEAATLTVVGEAANTIDAFKLAKHLAPNVIILDPEVLDPTASDLVCKLHTLVPEAALVILTHNQQSETIITAFRGGVKGYLPKSATSQELIHAIYQVVTGHCIIPMKLTHHLIDGLVNPTPTPDVLTERERDVLLQVTRGLENKEIAAELNISPNTVKTHMKRILTKLNLRSRTEAATYALNQGLIS